MLFMSCVCNALCLLIAVIVVTCLERADLLALVCGA